MEEEAKRNNELATTRNKKKLQASESGVPIQMNLKQYLLEKMSKDFEAKELQDDESV